jgi:hypothetical protein
MGSMPGTDPAEAAAVVVGELPDLPHLPELPGRGLGADMIGRTAALLVDLAVEVVPSAYRVTVRPGADHRRAVDLMQRDLDAFGDAVERAGGQPAAVKVQVAGPWTLTSEIELPRGHRVLTDHGARREFAESLAEGIAAHVTEVGKRTGRPVLVQLDEPSLPAVLAGALPTPSGLGTVPAVPGADVRDVLSTVVAAAQAATGQPVVVHCCATRPPVALLRAAGAQAIALDATLLGGAPAALADEIGEAWDAGTTFLLGLVPTTGPATPSSLAGHPHPVGVDVREKRRTPTPPSLAELAGPALRLVDRLGFPRSMLAERALPTPTCGLGCATAEWSVRALALARDLGRAFVEPPESW